MKIREAFHPCLTLIAFLHFRVLAQRVMTRILPSDQLVLEPAPPPSGQGSSAKGHAVVWCLVQNLDPGYDKVKSLELFFKSASLARSGEDGYGKESEGSFSQFSFPARRRRPETETSGEAKQEADEDSLAETGQDDLQRAEGFPDAQFTGLKKGELTNQSQASPSGRGSAVNNPANQNAQSPGLADQDSPLDRRGLLPGTITVARVSAFTSARLGVQHVQRSGVSVRGVISTSNPNLSSLQVSIRRATCGDCGTYVCVLRYHDNHQGNVTETRSSNDLIVAQSVTHRLNVRMRKDWPPSAQSAQSTPSTQSIQYSAQSAESSQSAHSPQLSTRSAQSSARSAHYALSSQSAQSSAQSAQSSAQSAQSSAQSAQSSTQLAQSAQSAQSSAQSARSAQSAQSSAQSAQSSAQSARSAQSAQSTQYTKSSIQLARSPQSAQSSAQSSGWPQAPSSQDVDLFCFGTISDRSTTILWRRRGINPSTTTPTPTRVDTPTLVRQGEPRLGQYCQHWRASVLRHTWTGSEELWRFDCFLSYDEGLMASMTLSRTGSVVTAVCGDPNSTSLTKQGDDVSVVCDVSTDTNVTSLVWKHKGVRVGRCDGTREAASMTQWNCHSSDPQYSVTAHNSRFTLTIARYDVARDKGMWECEVVPLLSETAASCVLG